MSSSDVLNARVDASLGEVRPPLEAQITDPSVLADLRRKWAAQDAIPVVARSREDGQDNSWGGNDVRTLVNGEQSGGRFSVHSVQLAPGATLDPHYFDDTHAVLLVVDGDVELRVGDTRSLVGRHGLGYAPPLTRHAVSNTGATSAEIMVVHSPAGTERAFAAARQQWLSTGSDVLADYEDVLARHGVRTDDAILENDSKTNRELPPFDFVFEGPGDLERMRQEFDARPTWPRLTTTLPAEYDAAAAGDHRRKHLLTGDTSGGNAMLNLISGLPGFGAPNHHQPTEEEFFFVTGGSLQLTCATETLDMGPGGFAFCPRNCTHGFRNITDSETWFVTLNSPAGHERTMAAVRQFAQSGASPQEIHDLAVAGGFVFHDTDV